MPLSSEAFNSSAIEEKFEPNIFLAQAKIVVVLPVPGGPWNNKWGILLLSISLFRTVTISSCETNSSRQDGLYFSTQGRACTSLGLSFAPPPPDTFMGTDDEDDEDDDDEDDEDDDDDENDEVDDGRFSFSSSFSIAKLDMLISSSR